MRRADRACRRRGETGERGHLATESVPRCLRTRPAALAFEAGDPAKERLLAPATGEEVVRAAARVSEMDEAPISVPQQGQGGLRLLRRIGVVDPESLDAYRAAGGYAALRNALLLGPAGVIREVTDSGLMGRGGAAFPTGRKWDATTRQPVQTRYLVCNADESEPGTFKDRVLIEGDPFALVEAMTIAAYAIGAQRGYVYLRGEYPRALRLLRNAIDVARERGLLGKNIMGHQGFSFDIEIRRGAGAYICGEETAIFNSIEGFRGEPRTKPPFPVEKGVVRQADGGEQRRDAGQRPADPDRRLRGVPADRHRTLDRAETVLPVRQRSASRRVRGSVRRDPRRTPHLGRGSA